jgi:hypothetical protein
MSINSWDNDLPLADWWRFGKIAGFEGMFALEL